MGHVETWKPGDKLVCRDSGANPLTVGKEYELIRSHGDMVIIVDDKDSPGEYFIRRFKLKKGSPMLEQVKKYYEKHQDVIFTIGAVLLMDYFLFNGALRTRVKELVEKMLRSVEKKFNEPAKTTTTPTPGA